MRELGVVNWDIVIQREHCDSKGRLIMLNAKIEDKNHFLINLYDPSKDAEAVRVCFYQNLSDWLRPTKTGTSIIPRSFIHCSLLFTPF